MSQNRYEIEPRSENLGGGWRLHLISVDPETGEEIFMGGGVFPVVELDDDAAVYSEALDVGREWMDSRSANEE